MDGQVHETWQWPTVSHTRLQSQGWTPSILPLIPLESIISPPDAFRPNCSAHDAKAQPPPESNGVRMTNIALAHNSIPNWVGLAGSPAPKKNLI